MYIYIYTVYIACWIYGVNVAYFIIHITNVSGSRLPEKHPPESSVKVEDVAVIISFTYENFSFDSFTLIRVLISHSSRVCVFHRIRSVSKDVCVCVYQRSW